MAYYTDAEIGLLKLFNKLTPEELVVLEQTYTDTDSVSWRNLCRKVWSRCPEDYHYLSDVSDDLYQIGRRLFGT